MGKDVRPFVADHLRDAQIELFGLPVIYERYGQERLYD